MLSFTSLSIYKWLHNGKLVFLIVWKRNRVVDYYEKKESLIEGCLGMPYYRHLANMWLLFLIIIMFQLGYRCIREGCWVLIFLKAVWVSGFYKGE